MNACRIALTGDVALEVLAAYFREAGYDVQGPDTPSAETFRPDFVYDVTAHDAVLASEVDGFFDERLRVLAGCRYSLDGIRAIVDEFGWHRLASPRKILAVDADNTLWRGILSEDGPAALEACAVFQRGLAELRDAGVVLVLLSKNDDEAVGTGPVDLGLFAERRVNWGPKAGNLIEACRALNLPTDAVVFVDDNPHERAQMAAHLPEVAVAPWNGWGDASGADWERAQRQLVRRLKEYFFADLGRTEEDRLRARDYARQRAVNAASYASKEDYLADLGLWALPARATEANLDRLAQMAGKTNQFNATTIRRTRADFAALLADPTKRVYVFRSGDRFGEQGLVCYVVVDLSARRITDFVMSCRAMGRTLEHFAYGHVTRDLGYAPPVDFVATAKNRPCAEFLASLGGELKTWCSAVQSRATCAIL